MIFTAMTENLCDIIYGDGKMHNLNSMENEGKLTTKMTEDLSTNYSGQNTL